MSLAKQARDDVMSDQFQDFLRDSTRSVNGKPRKPEGKLSRSTKATAVPVSGNETWDPKKRVSMIVALTNYDTTPSTQENHQWTARRQGPKTITMQYDGVLKPKTAAAPAQSLSAQARDGVTGVMGAASRIQERQPLKWQHLIRPLESRPAAQSIATGVRREASRVLPKQTPAPRSR